jgi:formylglycine-generating enzyme required for sulfatase activity
MMKKIILCFTYCLFAFSTIGQVPDNAIDSETILDGVYVAKHYNDVINYNLDSCYKNALFCLPYKYGTVKSIKIKGNHPQKKSGDFLKKINLDNLVYFDPTLFNLKTAFFLSGEDVIFSEMVFPFSIRYYLNSEDISLFPNQVLMQLDSNFTIDKKKYLSPFYFLQHEVSNAEYREFVAWVKDSIARRILANEFPEDFSIPIYDNNGKLLPKEEWPLNWNKEFRYPRIYGGPTKYEEHEYSDYYPLLSELYLQGSERFYSRQEIDTKKLIYEYSMKIDDTVLIKNIPVYPDTLCWINDFDPSFIEHMTNLYFWHPAYDQYPVVGVNHHQVMAFLHWKTAMHQKTLNNKKIPYEITYSLPTVAEWDMVSTANKENKQIKIYNKDYYHLGDNSWITDLSLNNVNNYQKIDSLDTIVNINVRADQLASLINKNNSYKEKFIIDGGFFTQKIMPEKKDKNSSFSPLNVDQNGIYYMGGNVSEWLQESYSCNWEPIYTKRHELLKPINDEDIQLLLQIENYFNKKNSTKGHLVMGANWYDERYSNKLGINTAGINAKTFADPSSSYSTLGFRYVVRVKEK